MSANSLLRNLARLRSVDFNTLRGVLTSSISISADQASTALTTIASRADFTRFTSSNLTNIFSRLSSTRMGTLIDNLDGVQLNNVIERIPTSQIEHLFTDTMIDGLTVSKASECLTALLRRSDASNIPRTRLTKLADKVESTSALTADQLSRLRRLGLRSSGTVAGAAADAVRSGGRVCRRNAALCAAGVAAGTYLAVNYAETSENVRECMAYCLPENWEEYKNDATTVLQYQTTASIQNAYTGADFPTDLFQEQPYCTVDHVTESDDACEIHCRDRCEEINQSVLGQLGEALGGLGDTLTSILGGTLDFINDPLGALQTVCLWIVGFIVGIILIKFIFGLIIKLIFRKKSRNTQAFSAQPIAQPIVVQLSERPTNSGPTV